MYQRIHFIADLPRSGSNLLAGLLRQNPRPNADAFRRTPDSSRSACASPDPARHAGGLRPSFQRKLEPSDFVFQGSQGNGFQPSLE